MEKSIGKEHYKISICVVCMNRLHHLRDTLIQNLNDNATYDNLEFVLLNYNSSDGMEEWVMENLTNYIKSGRLIYYKTEEPTSWNPSHSKNIAFNLATGDIICNIWADYFTGRNFAHYVNECFIEDDNIVLTPIDFYRTKQGYLPPPDVLGKVCVKKQDFLKIRGFDERINKHGFEDYDFVNRLEMIGVKRVIITDFNFLQFVAHDNDQRYNLGKDQLDSVYINYVVPNQSELLILFKDSAFLRATIVDNTTFDSQNPVYSYTPRNIHFEYSLATGRWLSGQWLEESLGISCITDTGTVYLAKATINGHQSLVEGEDTIFFRLFSEPSILSILEFKHFYDTRSIMESNLENQIATANPVSFGKTIMSYSSNAKVVKNNIDSTMGSTNE